MTKYYRKSKYKFRLSFICICATGFLLLNSCNKESTIIGSEILPPSDYISIFSRDTFRITSYTNYTREVNTDALLVPYIGTYYDPYFGTTTSGYVSQVRLEERFSDLNKWWELEEASWTVDSVKLVLRIISSYGSNNNFKYLRISEISDMLDNDTKYYSDTPVNTTGFGVSAVIPELKSDTINNIEINLPIAFGEHMIRDTSKLFYTTNPTEEDFRDYFKGIYITIPSASATDPFSIGLDFNYFGALNEDIYDYQNYIVLYLHDSESGYRDTYRFLLDSRRENARFTKIEHNFSSALPGKSIENIINKPIIDSLSYTQGLYGAFTTISIPGLEYIKNDAVRIRSAVNKAQLIIPAYFDNITYTDNTVAPKLLMRYVNESGEKEMVPDYYVDQYSEYFNGKLDTTNVYRFNLSSFVQKYFDDTENKLKPEVEIFLPANSMLNAILKANDSKTPPKFELTLTHY